MPGEMAVQRVAARLAGKRIFRFDVTPYLRMSPNPPGGVGYCEVSAANSA
jgi:hypothetical protein